MNDGGVIAYESTTVEVSAKRVDSELSWPGAAFGIVCCICIAYVLGVISKAMR